MNPRFFGSIVALVTPMHANGDIDYDCLDKLVEWHIEQNTQAIVAVGTTGESPTLTVKEHIDVIARVVKQAAGRIPIIAGTGSNSTQEAIEWSLAAVQQGADACLQVTPYYNKPTQNGLFLHFKAIADAVNCPHILYNVPGRTSVSLANKTVLQLAEVENIVAIKDASGNLEHGRELINSVPSSFSVLSGDDLTACELILAGAHGNISVTANIKPAIMSQLCQLAFDQHAEKARALQHTLMPLHAALFSESNPIPVKWALCTLGKINSGIRLPLTELSTEYHSVLNEALGVA